MTLSPSNNTCYHYYRFILGLVLESPSPCDHPTSPTTTVKAYYTPYYPYGNPSEPGSVRYEEQILMVPPMTAYDPRQYIPIPWSGIAQLPGRYRFRAYIDPDNSYQEANEGNNSYGTDFTIGPLPNLYLSAIQASSTVAKNLPMTVILTIRNTGTVAVNNVTPNFSAGTGGYTGNISDGLKNDIKLQNTVNNCPANLVPNASCTISFELLFSNAGIQTVYFAVDQPVDAVVEMNDYDNGRWVDFIVSGSESKLDFSSRLASILESLSKILKTIEELKK